MSDLVSTIVNQLFFAAIYFHVFVFMNISAAISLHGLKNLTLQEHLYSMSIWIFSQQFIIVNFSFSRKLREKIARENKLVNNISFYIHLYTERSLVLSIQTSQESSCLSLHELQISLQLHVINCFKIIHNCYIILSKYLSSKIQQSLMSDT